MTAVSFEFFPPKTDEQRQQLDKTAAKLAQRQPEYVSATFGAGGSTLSYTPETVRRLHDAFGLDATTHISWVGGSRDATRTLLAQYRAQGCKSTEERSVGNERGSTCRYGRAEEY